MKIKIKLFALGRELVGVCGKCNFTAPYSKLRVMKPYNSKDFGKRMVTAYVIMCSAYWCFGIIRDKDFDTEKKCKDALPDIVEFYETKPHNFFNSFVCYWRREIG